MQSNMKKLFIGLVLGLLSLSANAGQIELAQNLEQDALDSKSNGKPIVLFVTADDCPYCEQLRDEYFQFSTEDDRFLLREIELGPYHETLNYDGKNSNHQLLADRYDISLTPTIAFVGPDGEPLAKPIIGILTMDFYHYYFEKALAESIALLK